MRCPPHEGGVPAPMLRRAVGCVAETMRLARRPSSEGGRKHSVVPGSPLDSVAVLGPAEGTRPTRRERRFAGGETGAPRSGRDCGSSATIPTGELKRDARSSAPVVVVATLAAIRPPTLGRHPRRHRGRLTQRGAEDAHLTGGKQKMINGSVVAPFQHDSTWPEDVQTRFRSAVYYLHVHVPGRDPTNQLRELVDWVLSKKHAKSTSEQWKCLKNACNKIVHVSIDGVKDEEMRIFVKNLLVIANLLLISDYGLQRNSSLRFVVRDPVKQKEHETGSKAAMEKFLAGIDQAYASLEDAIREWRREGGNAKRRLKLGKGARVLSSIPSVHHMIDEEPSNIKMRITSHNRDPDKCQYEFRPADPIGWVMMNGNRSKDRFVDDPMSSDWTPGK